MSKYFGTGFRVLNWAHLFIYVLAFVFCLMKDDETAVFLKSGKIS